MILFAVRRCIFHKRYYNKIIVLLYCETDCFFQRQKIFQRSFYQFFSKKMF